MLLLMETYKYHIESGGRLHVPEDVKRNLQEQKEDNDKLEMWINANIVKDPEMRIHLHRISRAHDKMMRKTVRISTLTAKLNSLGFLVSAVGLNARDSGCCKSLCRSVSGANLLPWSKADGDEGGKVDESKGVAV